MRNKGTLVFDIVFCRMKGSVTSKDVNGGWMVCGCGKTINSGTPYQSRNMQIHQKGFKKCTNQKGQKSIKDMFLTLSSKSSAIIVSENVQPSLVNLCLGVIKFKAGDEAEFKDLLKKIAVYGLKQWTKAKVVYTVKAVISKTEYAIYSEACSNVGIWRDVGKKQNIKSCDSCFEVFRNGYWFY